MPDDLKPDELGDGGDDGISEGAQAVCPIGNAISQSTHGGFSCPPTSGS
jgi:hypothetical protein